MKYNPDLFVEEGKITDNNEPTDNPEVTVDFEKKPIRITNE